MCCIFTCCGWMVDLIQRLWVFMMSCCISTAVGCVMVTSSMSGIALGYNYSLAEYIELKETNVSVYLKRGIFDDEVADDKEWRRSGHHSRVGHLSDDNLRTGAPADDETTSIRSGRRLDDSVFEADDHNKFEGSLMKLTAKPVYLSTPQPKITEDFEMAEIDKKYELGSVDHLKAVQTLIDSRRRMANAGTTLTPLATYASRDHLLPYLPVNNDPNEPGNRDVLIRRRLEQGGGGLPPNINPARFAVPDESIGSRDNWVIPKSPFLFKHDQVPDYYVLSPTYPSAITVAPRIVRPTSSIYTESEGPVILVTRIIASTSAKTKAPEIPKIEDKESEMTVDKLTDTDTPGKINEIKTDDFNKVKTLGKTSEEEYEDEIKGLPVRRRRNAKESSASHQEDNDPDNLKVDTINDHENIDLNNDNQKADEDNHDLQNKRKQSLLSHLKKTIKLNKPTLEEVTPNEILTTVNNMKLSSGVSIESKIVSSKYVPNDEVTRFNTKQTTKSGQELLKSAVILNDAGLFKNSVSKFVKLLQSACA